MKRDWRIALVVAWSGAAAGPSSAGFTLNAVDLGGPEGLGTPIVTSTGFFQHAAGDNYPPLSVNVAFIPALGYDSYVLMDAGGPTTPHYSAEGPSGSSPGFGRQSGHLQTDPTFLTGGYYSIGSGAASGPDPFGTEGVMVAQLSVLNDGVLWSEGVTYHVTVEGVSISNYFTILNGAPVNGLVARTWLAHDDVTVEGVTFDVYQVWITQVSGPGAAITFVAGALATRRRRRGRLTHRTQSA